MAEPDKKDWLKIAQESFTDSNTFFDSNVRRQVEQALRMVQSKHPDGSKYFSDTYRTRSRIFRPKTRSALRKNEAVFASALFSNEDVVNISAYNQTTPENMASADLMQEIMQYRLTNDIKWFQLAIGAYQESQTNGIVVSYQYWDKKKDAPYIELVPIENIRFHPSSDWVDPINTSPYVIQMIPMFVKDVKARMKPKNGESEGKWKKLDDTQLLSATTNQNDSIRMTRQGSQRTDPQEASISLREHQIIWVHRNIIIDENGEDVVFYTLGTEHLLTDPVPLTDLYKHNIRPYTLGVGLIEAHKTYPESPVLLAKEIQGEINEVANQRIDNVKFAMNKRYFVKRGAQADIRSLVRNTPSSVTLMNDTDKDVKVVETQDVTASSYKEQEVLNLDFDDILGIFSNSSVQSNRKMNETVGGMEMLSDNANQVTEYGLRVFIETWVEPTLKQIVLLEQAYETDENILTIAGERAKLVKKYGISDITDDIIGRDLSVKVNVGLGATNPEQQFNKFITGINTSLEIMQSPVADKLEVEEVVKEIMSKNGYKNSERFFIETEDNQNPALTALQEQVAQLQQQLEAKMPQKIVDATAKKLNAEADKAVASMIETYVKSQYGAMQAGQVVATTPTVTPIADAILDGAGFVAKNNAEIPQPEEAAMPMEEQPMEEKMELPMEAGMPEEEQMFEEPVTSTNEIPAIDSPIDDFNQGIETLRPDGGIDDDQ